MISIKRKFTKLIIQGGRDTLDPGEAEMCSAQYVYKASLASKGGKVGWRVAHFGMENSKWREGVMRG